MQLVDATLRDELGRAATDVAYLSAQAREELQRFGAMVDALRECVEVMSPEQLARLSDTTCDTISLVATPDTPTRSHT